MLFALETEVAFVAYTAHSVSMAISSRSGKKPRQLSQAIPARERMSAARIASLLSPNSRRKRGVVQVIDAKGHRHELPILLVDVMYRAAGMLAEGRPVAVLSDENMLSTQAAADLLDVSRQYLVRIVDAGELVALKVGSHRRLRVADVVAFQIARDAKRTSALDRLIELSEATGGYALDRKPR